MYVCARIWAYAKLFCYNLMTQTHAARATETGVGDSCIFNTVCTCIPSCMHACMRVCLCAGVVSRNSVLQTVFHLDSKAAFRQAARVPSFFVLVFFLLFGTSSVEADCLDQVQTEKKISNKSMFGNQN